MKKGCTETVLKKAITYQNLDGEEVTEEFHFQLTKAEVAERALIEGSGYADRLKALSVETDGAKIIKHFKEILESAVGRREGQLFIKNDDVRNHFMFSGAYDVFFMDLLEEKDSGAEIIKAMLPKDAHEAIDAELAKRNATTTELPAAPPKLEGESDGVVTLTEDEAQVQTLESGKDETPAWLKEKRQPTKDELKKMSQAEMLKVFEAREKGIIS